MATTRLLLPFTGSINTQALTYAIQLAEYRQATLVPLALIRVKANKAVRLEYIQQAQDFLEFTRCKAERQGVPIEQARIYTGDVTRSIEAVSGELNCEAVLLFLCARGEAFLEPTEINALMDSTTCNVHVVLLLPRSKWKHPLHVQLLKRPGRWMSGAKSGTLLDTLVRK